MEKKSYSKPVLMAERFEPQEYIAGCYKWGLELICTGGAVNGDHYVFNDTDPTAGHNAAVGQITHAGHSMGYIYVRTETPDYPQMSDPAVQAVIASVGEFPAAMGNDQNTQGNPAGARYWMVNKHGQYQIGYAWVIDGDLHFHEGEMEWQLISGSDGAGPNAS